MAQGGNYGYQSDHTAGLRILDLTKVANPASMSEAAYFDVYPSSNSATFHGTCSRGRDRPRLPSCPDRSARL